MPFSNSPLEKSSTLILKFTSNGVHKVEKAKKLKFFLLKTEIFFSKLPLTNDNA